MNTTLQEEVRRHLRHNILVNTLEGTFFWIGMAFYSYQTVLPLFVSKLSDSPYPLGILAMLGNSGWLLPQLFTARWVQRTPVKKNIVVRVGFFSERLPYVLLALLAWTIARPYPRVALVATLVIAAWGAYGAGLIAIAWQSMIAKIIPQELRGRFIGVTSALGMIGGALAASFVAYVLNAYPFPRNFAISFSLGALFTLLSWFILSLTREPPDPPLESSEEPLPLWREVPRVLRRDANFAGFLLARGLGALGLMGMGFLAVYAIRRWHLSDGQAGVFGSVMMGSQFLAYLVLGVLADRQGHKRVLELGALATALGFGVATLAPLPHFIYLSFVGLGMMQASYIVSGMMIVPEFAPPEELAIYFGIASTLTGMVAVLVPIVGAWIASLWGYPTVFAISGGAALLSWVVYAVRVQDPRFRQGTQPSEG